MSEERKQEGPIDPNEKMRRWEESREHERRWAELWRIYTLAKRWKKPMPPELMEEFWGETFKEEREGYMSAVNDDDGIRLTLPLEPYGKKKPQKVPKLFWEKEPKKKPKFFWEK